MSLGRVFFALCVVVVVVIGYLFAVPKPVTVEALEGEEACPSVMVVGADGAMLRVRPLRISRQSGVLVPGAPVYLCDDAGEWVGVVAPGDIEACTAASRDQAEPLPETCPTGWMRKSEAVLAAG